MAEPAKKQPVPTPTPAPAPKPKESKAARFKRLGEKRVPAALKRIEYVGNLAAMGNYDYTPAQSERIVKCLEEAVAAVKAKFMGVEIAAKSFTL